MTLGGPKTLLYSDSRNHHVSGGNLLTVNRAAIRLKRNRQTIQEWIQRGLLVPFESERLSKRMTRWFENDYIDAVAKILPKPKLGGHVLDDDLRAAIEGINKRFGKKK